MKTFTLKHYKEIEIDKKILDELGLEPRLMQYSDLGTAWTRYISGSKIKDILKRPLTAIGYLSGWVSQEVWEEDINVIPKMELYRQHGTLMEDVIVDRFNQCIENEWQVTPLKDTLSFRDLLVDSTSVKRHKKEFAPSATEKKFVYADKRSFFKKNKDGSEIFMANIDGITFNADGSVDKIVEIKTKSGELSGKYNIMDIVNLHIDQITYYAKTFKAKNGALLLVDHHSRGLKTHIITPQEIDANWEKIGKKIQMVALIVMQIRNKTLDPTYLDLINWGEDEKIDTDTLKLYYNSIV